MISSTPGNLRSSSSPAAMFSVGSSRITVCGQAPASTAETRAGSIRPERLQPFGVFLGDEIVGHHGKIDAAAGQDRDQAFDQCGLAGADRAADADARGADAGRVADC